MSLPDSAEYWQDVKRPYTGETFLCVPEFDCGYKHHAHAVYIDEVNCKGCLKLLKTGKEHGLKSAEDHTKAKAKRDREAIKKVKKRWQNKYPNNPVCECGFVLVERSNKSSGNKFWGCCQYPICKNTRPIARD